LFWTTYFTKLFVELNIIGEEVAIAAETYWIWSIGTCFLPSLAAFLSSEPARIDWMRGPATLAALVASALLLLFGSTLGISHGSVIDLNRWNVEALNPISMGHLGVTLALLGAASFLSRPTSFSVVAASIGLIVPGLAVAILANSRGPLVALTTAFALLVLARANRKRTLALGAALAVVAVYIATQHSDFIFGHGGVFDRFISVQEGRDLSSELRLTAYKSALSQFWQSPFFGGVVEEPVTHFYPHNVVLEALMATGVFGGLPFILLLVLSLLSSWRILRSDSPNVWVALLCVQYIVGAQFSGGLYNSTAMWILLPLSISLANCGPSRNRLSSLTGNCPQGQTYMTADRPAWSRTSPST
jgi:O-antigen ligase